MLPDDAALISVSDHVFEVPDMFAGTLPPHRADDAPRVVDLGRDAGEAWVFGDVVVPFARMPLLVDEHTAEPRHASYIAEVPEPLRFAGARLAAMDRDGVRTHVLFPQLIGFAGEQLLNLTDATARAAACRGYNEHLGDAYHATAPDRLVPVAVVPLPDAELAAKELRRAVANGARGVSLPCNPAVLGLPSWHEPHWEPLLEAAVETGVPVFLHIATMRAATGASPAAHGSTPGGPLGAMLTLLNLDVMTAVVELAFSPVLVRHPELRVVVLEGGAAWFPYLCERIDFFWGNRGERGKGPGTVRDRPPSELLDRALALGFIDDPAALRNRAEIGVPRMMWMSDFPHEDGFWPNNRTHLAASLADVPDAEARAITSGNAAALLGLDVGGATAP